MPSVRRFNAYHRILHVVMATSFIGLVMSGMPIKYADAPWALWIMKLLGGYRAAGIVHRVCAVITFGYFAAHLSYVAYYVAVVRKFRFDPMGPESMVPRIKDFEDLADSVRWFLGRGPKPVFDRFTYWEKFDYWAVFWGVGMIGMSGLLLWFPEFFGRLLPGWAFNVAGIIHGDEALLASGFIFTIHFFNTHLRPEKFPMDIVIFSGTVSLRQLERERPLEYQRLRQEVRLEQAAAKEQPEWLTDLGILFGFVLMAAGFGLLVLILLGQFYY